MMTLDDFKTLTEIITSILTVLSLIVGGVWVFYRFILQQERYPNINFTTDITVIGEQDNSIIIELVAIIDNKGKAQHKMENFGFELNALNDADPVERNEIWGNQTDFIRRLASGSYLPRHQQFFFVDPGTTAKYSHITHVPSDTSFLMLHSNFHYMNRNSYMHTAERTIKLR